MVDGQTQASRRWKGNDGKFEVDAVYVGIFQKTKVKLRKTGGAMIAVPLDRLCQEDIDYVNSKQSLSSAAVPATKEKELALMPGFFQLQPSSATTTIAGTLVHQPGHVEAVILTPLERGMPQQVRAMRPESLQALSQLTLSSVTGRLLSAQAHWRPRPQTLAGFPPNILANIGKYLDAKSRVRLALVSRSFFHAMFRPEAWQNVWFLRQDLYSVDSSMVYAMTDTLLRHQLLHTVYSISLSGSAVTADGIVHLLVNFPELRNVSLKGCWEVHSFPLGGKLMQVAAMWQKHPLKLEVFELGKALRRGVSKQELEEKPNAPQSFGQDLSVISNALQKLAHHPVKMDCFICDFCHFGAAAAFVNCIGCGPVQIHKCTTCAPRCDRCSVRVCNMPNCPASRSIEITTTTCKQCEKPLSICNQSHTRACQRAKQPCKECHGMFHTQCRTSDGGYLTNQCTRCGTVACPTCELTACSGGCQGNWCRSCVNDVGLSHCKCIVLSKSRDKIRKRKVCGRCQKSCSRCKSTGFCPRCLGVHSQGCR